MSIFDQVELSALPVPKVIEELDYEALLTESLTVLRAHWPEFDALVESDPAVKLAELAAYLSLNLRGAINDGAKACMLAYAAGSDLDALAAFYSVARAVIDPGDPGAIPPRPAVLEDDARFRRRAQLAPEAMTSAGTRGAYAFHALAASPLVADVAVSAHDPVPGDVTVTILAAGESWTPDGALLNAVNAALQSDEVRPVNDTVHVEGAAIVDVDVAAAITWLPGVASEPAGAEQQARIDALTARRALGRDLARSEIIAALHVPGVHSVDLTSPAADVTIGPKQAARIASVTLADGGVDE